MQEDDAHVYGEGSQRAIFQVKEEGQEKQGNGHGFPAGEEVHRVDEG